MAPEVSAAAAAALEVCRCHMSQICVFQTVYLSR
jgi:hypothetical protein